ncbi:hypothetical protein [Kitasatospora sp. A2-31]|uniref:hypothetical protein n=1 Tax=Kitasatospora sp. A2-31 TaxID=2916414 RepID=UPI001EECE359|nr:hypothetical protein [Kitasatospora sp. A2-31]MCG6497625.1 hypothetical protein [Kitasatospora sp. A2-31]
MTYAITAAAHTTVPVTWTTEAGTTATAHMPTQFHATYAAAEHTSAVVQLAEAPQQVTPAVTQAASPGAIAGMSGATLVGLGILIWTAAKWKQQAKEVKRAFILGAVAMALVGSWGLLGVFSSTVKSTSDSVGTSISNTVGTAPQTR